ncbi:MAG: hypothetical protein ACPG36_02670, partial [Candidatus Puniceispirillaceae bacterium]
MQDVGAPDLIVEGAASPHTYSLKPSQARKLQDADLVFWIGHELEAFLEKPIDGIATGATAVSLLDSHGLTRITFREGGAFDDHGHDHDDHGHDEKHDDHGHDEKHDDHGHDEKHDDHGHDEKHDDHEHDEKHDDHGHDEKHDDHGHDEKHDDHG